MEGGKSVNKGRSKKKRMEDVDGCVDEKTVKEGRNPDGRH